MKEENNQIHYNSKIPLIEKQEDSNAEFKTQVQRFSLQRQSVEKHSEQTYPININSVDNFEESNKISTSKYQWYNCIPKIMIEQFSKMANIYFLLIAIMQVKIQTKIVY